MENYEAREMTKNEFLNEVLPVYFMDDGGRNISENLMSLVWAVRLMTKEVKVLNETLKNNKEKVITNETTI